MSRFEKKLEKQIRTREREIERMCGFHYTNFVEAINELSGIEGDATKLVRKVASTNHDLQELGGKILGKYYISSVAKGFRNIQTGFRNIQTGNPISIFCRNSMAYHNMHTTIYK